MAVTNYYTVNGEIIGEKVGAGARTDYLTDALGSVTATLNQSAQVVNTYRYKPYGALLAKTGVGADPAFQWVGSRGYRQTSKRFSDVYVRARHYDTNTAGWTTKDPWSNMLLRVSTEKTEPRSSFMPIEPSVARLLMADSNKGKYLYANSSPALRTDETGLQVRRKPDLSSWLVPGNCILVAGVPPEKIRDCGSTESFGCTNCNFGIGVVYSFNCNPTCASPCTSAHEAVHRGEIRSCCSNLIPCYTKTRPGQGIPERVHECIDDYVLWHKAITAWTECHAYRKGYQCAVDMMTGGCFAQGISCCMEVEEYLWNESRGVQQNCPGKYFPCPIAPDGLIDENKLKSLRGMGR